MMMMRRTMTGIDEDLENYCCHEVMMKMRRRRRKQTGTDDDKDYCGDDMMIRRTMTTRKRTWTFVWFPSQEKRKMHWYYCHLYGSHWTIRYSLHPTWTTDRDMRMVGTRYTIIRVSIHPYHYDTIIETSTASPNCMYMFGIIVY